MQLLVIGLNHKTAPVDIRERLAFGSDLPVALQALQQLCAGAIVLSTCNRTELYLLAHEDDTLEHLTDNVMGWLADFKAIARTAFANHLYVYENTFALTHFIRVASGLDSMILGEPQILGQIKQAVEQSQQQNTLPKALNWFVQQVFATAKLVRNETKVGSQAVSLGFASVKLVTQIFNKPENNTLLVVAAGEMNRLVATNLAGLGIKHIIICNRTLERAKLLADELARAGRTIEIVGLDKLAEVLPKADIITSCSGSLHALIDKSMVKHALKIRRHQPMLMIDLAVPRDIEPSVGDLDDVFLYSIDDLQHVIAGNLEQRRQAAVEAELLVSQQVVNIERKLLEKQVGQQIGQYREQAKLQADEILQQSLAKIQNGDDAQKVLIELTHKLTQTLTHAPTKMLKAIASEQPSDTTHFITYQLMQAFRD